ncbi:response regulator transcription factor [Kordia sp.]|uniref:response regulator transcription factor n=1 Tax=Kordia sp. TaxID=1965332 RepID=UPI0025BAA8B2|nr:response regulator transcription factor [Kordia sp.]MCH2196555.1 response regulator transcription factor [Kordia sp.]
MSYKIVIAEDNTFLANALVEKLSFFKEDLQYMFRARDGKELLEKLEKKEEIDLILMDIKMPNMNGIEATQLIKKRFPSIKIVMITVFDDDENILQSIQSGANGYLLKEATADELHKGILDVMKGGATMTPSIAMKTLKILQTAEVPQYEENENIKLSKREKEVLEQLSKGLGYQIIAEKLFVSPSTIRKHIENIYKKLQVHNKIEAVEKARKHRLL